MSNAHAQTTDRLRRLLLAVPNRRSIYEAISRRPGIHVRGLSRDVGLALGSIEHHLRQLERHSLIFSHHEGRRRTYYCADSIDPQDAPLLHALGKELCVDILAALVLGDVSSVSGVAGRIGIPTTIASHHMRRLRDQEILDHCRIGRESVYLVKDPERVLRLIRTHHKTTALTQEGPDPGFHPLVLRASIISRRMRSTQATDAGEHLSTIGPITW